MRFLGVIPARYFSTRLEGKPLKNIEGHSMIEWVYKRAIKSKLDSVIVATDDIRIYNEVIRFGGKVILTSSNHENGTSRIAEVCEKLENCQNTDVEVDNHEVIINIQGDEPLIEAEMINLLIEAFKNEESLLMGTLKHKITKMEEIENPNCVKVVTDKNDYALYFSRSPIPYPRTLNLENYYKHVGIYGYKKEFVKKYSEMISTPLEESESLEQLRVLENGFKIKVLETSSSIQGIDTQEDLEKVIEYIKENNITL